jgi:curved DNA-binding protein CbpA
MIRFCNIISKHYFIRTFIPFGSSGSSRITPSSTTGHIDYYSILGVTRDVEGLELKTCYYNLAKQFHPDSTINYDELAKQWAARRFQLIGVAYNILSDKAKRQHYDTFLDLTAVGDQDRMIHWLKIHRPPEQLSPPRGYPFNTQKP